MNDCIEWDGYRMPKMGYGRRRYRGGKWLVHRAAWTEHVGEIPEGMQVLHLCDNPACYNIDHLFLGTNQDNMDDKVNKGRQYRGERHFAAKLNEAKVREIRSMYDTGEYGMRELGRKFGVHHGVISKIVHNKLWIGV